MKDFPKKYFEHITHEYEYRYNKHLKHNRTIYNCGGQNMTFSFINGTNIMDVTSEDIRIKQIQTERMIKKSFV